MYNLISKLLKFLPKKNVLYVNLEHEKLRHITVEDLSDLIAAYYELLEPDRNKPIYLFLDEIQAVNGWYRWVNRIYESKEFHIYISGSSSKLLSREIATEMRGRSVAYVLLPYSFREILKIRDIALSEPRLMLQSEKRGHILAVLQEYLQYGGYPEILENLVVRDKLLHSYIDAIVIRDIGERFNVEPLLLSYMFEYLSSSYSKYFSGSRAYNFLKSINYSVGKERPLQVLGFFEEALSVFSIEIFSKSTRSRKQYPRKVYLVDNGLINAMNSIVDQGRGMENIVLIELCRRSELFVRFTVNYWKEYGRAEGREVDFVIVKGGKVKKLINVSYARAREDVKDREIKGLEMAAGEFMCDQKTIITWDYSEDGEIRFIPLWLWLLENDTL